MRLAWFSPMPPVRSGIAACSAELVEALAAEHVIDVYVDTPMAGLSAADSAHDFVWRHRIEPYDLTVFQLGNSSHHDYLWPYLFRYPGLAVLHDAHLHHARAAALLRTRRSGDYRAEFVANHPDTSADLAELAIKGFDSHLYYSFPMTRLVVEASRLTAVHAPGMVDAICESVPGARVEAIRLGHGVQVSPAEAARARADVRSRRGISPGAVVFGVFGGLTPEKRLPQVLDALTAVLPYAPSAHLLLAGPAARHYDAAGDVARRGLAGHVTITGYLESDDDLTAHIAACDVVLNLRWPTAREMSGPWLRALAAGRATVTIDLAHMADVAAFDPRTWTVSTPKPEALSPKPVTVAIDILDEDHSLRLAMRRLAADAELRDALGRAGQEYWRTEHSIDAMVEDYRRVLSRAAATPAPRITLPAHMRTDGTERLESIMSEMGLQPPVFFTTEERRNGDL